MKVPRDLSGAAQRRFRGHPCGAKPPPPARPAEVYRDKRIGGFDEAEACPKKENRALIAGLEAKE